MLGIRQVWEGKAALHGYHGVFLLAPFVAHTVLKDEGRGAIHHAGVQLDCLQAALVPQVLTPDVLLRPLVCTRVPHHRCQSSVKGAHSHASTPTQGKAQVEQRCCSVLVRPGGHVMLAPPDLRLHGPKVPTLAHCSAENLDEPGDVSGVWVLRIDLALQAFQPRQHSGPTLVVDVSEAFQEGQQPSGSPPQPADAGRARHEGVRLRAPVVHAVPVRLQQALALAPQLEPPGGPAPLDLVPVAPAGGPRVDEAREGPLRVLT
mmetsp:Transcript_125217/g.365713  ORF Transcript_125217/g.365713 Transcript_125217/m.365713 type:complete len:261 (-) Transcript_125217:312-1094(-)